MTFNHEVKILPWSFAAVADGLKTAELRRNDRDYQENDTILLKEWTAAGYTGRTLPVRVTHIMRWERMPREAQVAAQYVILSVKVIDEEAEALRLAQGVARCDEYLKRIGMPYDLQVTEQGRIGIALGVVAISLDPDAALQWCDGAEAAASGMRLFGMPGDAEAEANVGEGEAG
jgi:hypothetical protein